jgi:hypothetical protein
VSNTSNFEFCVELSLATVQEIFHLAFKNEALFPHNIGPISETFSGQAATVSVTVLDDDSNPANVTLQDSTHLLFSLPIQMTVEIPGAPDPSLSHLVLSCVAQIPGLFVSGTDPVNPDLSISFNAVTAGDVNIVNLTGLPTIDASTFLAAINAQYAQIGHVYTYPAPGGTATLQLYDGTLDTSLQPPYPNGSAITASLVTSGGDQYLNVTLPIWVNVPTGVDGYVYTNFGTIVFWREVQTTDTTVSVDMSTEPPDPTLATQVNIPPGFGGAGPAIAAQLLPLVNSTIGDFGVITEPAFTQTAAIAELQKQAAAYVDPLSYPIYTPQSGTPSQPLSTPVGFCLPADGVVAILLNRNAGSTPADDTPPDNFLGTDQVALAVSAAEVIAQSNQVISAKFPGVNNGGAPISTSAGNGTLNSISIVPEDSGAHGQSPGHLWVSGDATADIPCWFNVDVDFSGPVFVTATEVQTAQGCSLSVVPVAGTFSIHESCCSVLLDLLIPIVGWIMLAVVNSTVSDIGGQLVTQVASQEAQAIQPLPPTIIGIAQVTACLTGLVISSQGFVFPGAIAVVRIDRSFQNLMGLRALPRSDFP